MNVAMSVPLRIGEDVIGVLNLGSSANADKLRFSSNDKRSAYLFAEHAAIAVDRAGTHDWTRGASTGDSTEDQKTPARSATVRARTIEN
jgi:hypothetical protein